MGFLIHRPRLKVFRLSSESPLDTGRLRVARLRHAPARLGRQRTLRSCLCREEQLLAPAFLAWTEQLHESRGQLHRKIWEWCFICQALDERDMLVSGRTGLGFAVGREPLHCSLPEASG